MRARVHRYNEIVQGNHLTALNPSYLALLYFVHIRYISRTINLMEYNEILHGTTASALEREINDMLNIGVLI